MTETIVLVRINGTHWWPFRVLAADEKAAQVCARVHVEAVTGLRTEV